MSSNLSLPSKPQVSVLTNGGIRTLPPKPLKTELPSPSPTSLAFRSPTLLSPTAASVPRKPQAQQASPMTPTSPWTPPSLPTVPITAPVFTPPTLPQARPAPKMESPMNSSLAQRRNLVKNEQKDQSGAGRHSAFFPPEQRRQPRGQRVARSLTPWRPSPMARLLSPQPSQRRYFELCLNSGVNYFTVAEQEWLCHYIDVQKEDQREIVYRIANQVLPEYRIHALTYKLLSWIHTRDQDYEAMVKLLEQRLHPVDYAAKDEMMDLEELDELMDCQIVLDICKKVVKKSQQTCKAETVQQ
ncbi:hypothetical protein AAE478_002900 [Parahypoxylon ruwenzoriense]